MCLSQDETNTDVAIKRKPRSKIGHKESINEYLQIVSIE